MDKQLNQLASNMAVQIGNLNLELSKVQSENEQLQQRNAQLQETINTLRKEGKHESSADNVTDKQINQHC
ncbi:hypothetical protein [uncultured Lactobacillus sp.]|uniref:hypothetical protein n=1 Tax=uncultured Lactobacillus sp. TaxID=153152 RepID=UPI0025EF2AA9|nr:hypothetical protein [uncultured Lactobacillus sp.]